MRPVETVDTTFAPLSPNLQRLILSQMRFFVESSRTRTNIENEYFRIFLIKNFSYSKNYLEICGE